jgi:hypothetical protein
MDIPAFVLILDPQVRDRNLVLHDLEIVLAGESDSFVGEVLIGRDPRELFVQLVFEFVVEDHATHLTADTVNFLGYLVVELVEVHVMAGFLGLDKAVINRLPMRNQILASQEPMALSRQGKNLLRVRLMPFDAMLFDEPLAAKIPNVAFHAPTVTAIGEPSQIVRGNHAELPNINEGSDLGLPQGILSVAATIDSSRAVISARRPSGFLISTVIRPPRPMLTSPRLFRPSAA